MTYGPFDTEDRDIPEQVSFRAVIKSRWITAIVFAGSLPSSAYFVPSTGPPTEATKRDFPVAHRIAGHTLTLPIDQRCDESDMDRVADALLRVL